MEGTGLNTSSLVRQVENQYHHLVDRVNERVYSPKQSIHLQPNKHGHKFSKEKKKKKKKTTLVVMFMLDMNISKKKNN